MRYDGQVTIVLGIGTEVPGHGSFRTSQQGHLRSWEGKITSDDFAGLTRAHEVGNLLLRLPDGSEGKAVASNLSGLSGAGLGSVLTIQGSGPPPF